MLMSPTLILTTAMFKQFTCQTFGQVVCPLIPGLYLETTDIFTLVINMFPKEMELYIPMLSPICYLLIDC